MPHRADAGGLLYACHTNAGRTQSSKMCLSAVSLYCTIQYGDHTQAQVSCGLPPVRESTSRILVLVWHIASQCLRESGLQHLQHVLCAASIRDHVLLHHAQPPTNQLKVCARKELLEEVRQLRVRRLSYPVVQRQRSRKSWRVIRCA